MKKRNKQFLTCPRCSGTGRIELASVGFGDILKHFREGQRLTQDQLAEKVGITRAAIANLEVNRAAPSWNTIKGCAEALGVTMKDLMPA